jgi:hypothetical protein
MRQQLEPLGDGAALRDRPARRTPAVPLCRYCGGYSSNTGSSSPPQDQVAREP